MEDVLQRIEQKIDAMGGRLGAVEGGLSGLTVMVHQQGVLQEAMRDDIKQTLEGVIGLQESMDRRFDEVMVKLDDRERPIELATRYLATKKPKARG